MNYDTVAGFVRKNKTLLLSILFLTLFSLSVSYAAPLAFPYTPGQTLDPQCAPGSSNCVVSQPVLFQQPVQYATTVALPANTYNNGAAGVGATLIEVGNGALTVDGFSPSVGDRILVANEATQANNGIYTVTATGDASDPYILTRDTYSIPANLVAGSQVYVQYGTVNGGTTYKQTTQGTITIGTTNLVYVSSVNTTGISYMSNIGDGSSYSPTFIQFSKVGWATKGSIGALGQFEMNMSYNMDYTTGVHKYYNQSDNAYWFTLNQFGAKLQYAPSGYNGTDIWTGQGSPVPWQLTGTGVETLQGKGQSVTTSWNDAGTTAASLVVQDLSTGSLNGIGGSILFADVYGNNAYIHLSSTNSGGLGGNLFFGTRSAGVGASMVTQMALMQTGDLGLGTTAPTASFQVVQPTTGTGSITTTASGTTVTGLATQFTNTFKVGDTITANGETHTITAIGSNTSLTTDAWTNANSGVAYTLTGGTRFSVLGNGNVGIGTSTPAGLLSIAGNRTTSAWGLNGINFQTAAATYTDSSTAASGTATNVVVNSFGIPTITSTNTGVTDTNAATVYIGGAPVAGTNTTLTNKYALWVASGLSQFGSSSVTTGTTVATFQNAGGTCNVVPSTTGGITCSSDMTLKKNIANLSDNSNWSFNSNITPASQSVFDRVMALNPVNYNWNIEKDSDPKHAGFIAQEVEQVFPDLVSEDPTTHLLSLDYTGLIPYTVEAIKEMNVKIHPLPQFNDSTMTDRLSEFLKNIGESGLGIFKQVNTDKLCVDDVCVTRDQFLQIVQNSGVATTTSSSQTQSSTSNDPSTTTAPVTQPPAETQSPETQSPDVQSPTPDSSTGTATQ